MKCIMYIVYELWKENCRQQVTEVETGEIFGGGAILVKID